MCNVSGTTSKTSITHLGPIFHCHLSCCQCYDQFPFWGPCRGHIVSLGDAEAETQTKATQQFGGHHHRGHSCTVRSATATTIVQNFHMMVSTAHSMMDPKSKSHDSTPGNSHNDYAEFSHDRAKVLQQRTWQQLQRLCGIFTRWTQSCTKRNNIPSNSCNDLCNNTTTHNKTAIAMATTIMWNFHMVSTQKIPAGQNGLNTSFSKENSE